MIGLMLGNVSFGQKTYNFFCTRLSNLFEQFVNDFPSEKYYIISEKQDSSYIITFGTSGDVPEHFIDYYVFDDKRLITYYSVDSIYDKAIIDTAKMIRYNNKLGELSNSTYFSNCITHSKSYIVCESLCIEIKNDSCFDKYSKAIDTNGICSNKFNKALNSFINTYKRARVYEICFFKLGRKFYAAIYWNHFYDLNSIDAYFYRNGNFIALYGLKNLPPNCNIIDLKKIIVYNKCIRGIRCGTRSNWYISWPSVYCIGNKRIKHIRDSKVFDLITQCIYNK